MVAVHQGTLLAHRRLVLFDVRVLAPQWAVMVDKMVRLLGAGATRAMVANQATVVARDGLWSTFVVGNGLPVLVPS